MDGGHFTGWKEKKMNELVPFITKDIHHCPCHSIIMSSEVKTRDASAFFSSSIV